MKVAIVEDEASHSMILENYIKIWSASCQAACRIQKYASAAAFLFDWEEEKDFSVIFLDIQMAGMDGMSLARRIRKDSEAAAIVFTTGIDDFLQEGYEVAAIHYLLKPLSEEKVHLCLDRVFRKAKKEEPNLVLRTKDGTERTGLDQIWRVCAMGHHTLIKIQSPGGTEDKKVQDSMGTLEKALLSHSQFLKCHRSYVVNLSHVHRIEKTDILMDDGERVPLSRRLYREANEKFIAYYIQNKDS